MSANAAASGKPGRSRRALAAGLALLLLLFGAVTLLMPRTAPPTEPEAPVMLPQQPSADAVLIAATTPTQVPAPVQPARGAVAAKQDSKLRANATAHTVASPYRILGITTSDAQRSIVLFGRGRVITLHGPGQLDEEYVVEVVLDDAVLLRHIPTGAGTFLSRAERRPPEEPGARPEDTPLD